MRPIWYSLYAFATTLALYSIFFRPSTPPVAPPVTPPLEVSELDPLEETPVVQIALLLDTSSSMDGLVDQARQQMWEVVADLQTDENDQPRAVSVALYQYGNSNLPSEAQYIEQLSPLTTDLDQVTVKLHGLATRGGKEYAPTAIARAVEELDWSDDDGTLRCIIVAGNESFHQGPTTMGTALDAAANRGIRVLPVFCAPGRSPQVGHSSWQEAAKIAGTTLETINSDQQVVESLSPYDQEILQKSQQLQETNLFTQEYRPNAFAGQAEQCITEKVAVDRAVVRNSQATEKDFVAAYASGEVKLEAVPGSALPAQLQGKSRQEQSQLLAQRQKEREALQNEIQTLSKKRKEYLDGQAPSATDKSLGQSIRRSLAR